MTYACPASAVDPRAAMQAALCAIREASGIDPAPRRAQRRAAEAQGLRPSEIRRRRREAAERAKSHRVALYLASITFDVPARALARAEGVSERQVRRALRAIEDARDIPAVDRVLDALQGRMTV
jgi:DNA invertase Pin-like site-specific DNA recombinase